MSFETPPPQDYQKGFNEGYLLAKHRPDISDGLKGLHPDTPRLEGMKDGQTEYEYECLKQKEALQNKNAKNQERDTALDLENDLEPDFD